MSVVCLSAGCCDAISDEEWWQDVDGESRLQLHILWFGLVWFGTHKSNAMLWASNYWTVHICSNFKQCYLCPSMNTHLWPKWKIIAMKGGTNCKYWCVRNCPICHFPGYYFIVGVAIQNLWKKSGRITIILDRDRTNNPAPMQIW